MEEPSSVFLLEVRGHLETEESVFHKWKSFLQCRRDDGHTYLSVVPADQIIGLKAERDGTRTLTDPGLDGTPQLSITHHGDVSGTDVLRQRLVVVGGHGHHVVLQPGRMPGPTKTLGKSIHFRTTCVSDNLLAEAYTSETDMSSVFM